MLVSANQDLKNKSTSQCLQKHSLSCVVILGRTTSVVSQGKSNTEEKKIAAASKRGDAV